jgi:hypothetical protein
MSTNLAMNPEAVLTDRRHPNAQRLADGAATFARTYQGDQGNFPGSEPVFSRDKTHTTTRRTRAHSRLSLSAPVKALLSGPTKLTTSKASSTAPECPMSQRPVWAPSPLQAAEGP